MSRGIRPSLRSGWTLLELILALAIAVLIAGIGAAVFRIPFQSVARLAGPHPRDTDALRRFREDLASLAALPGSKTPALVLTPPGNAPAPLVLELICARSAPEKNDPRALTLHQVTHRFESGTNDPPGLRWIRKTRPLDDLAGMAREDLLSDGFSNITVEAWNGRGWTNVWTDTPAHRFPPALRIELQRDARRDAQIVSLPAGFTVEPERASPTSRATSGRGGQRTGSRQTGALPSPGR